MLCRPAPPGPNSTDGIPACAENRGVRPEGHARSARGCNRRPNAGSIDAAAADDSRIELVRGPRRPNDQLGSASNSGSSRRSCASIVHQLPRPTSRRLRPAACAARTAACTGPDSCSALPALDERRVQGAGALKRMRRPRAGSWSSALEARRARVPSARSRRVPRAGRLPCAARPSRLDLDPRKALVPDRDVRSVGSVTTAMSARQSLTSASAPRLSVPRRQRRRRSGGREATGFADDAGGGDHRGHAALHVLRAAAVQPAVATGGVNGSSMPATPTVSMWPQNISDGPARGPRARQRRWAGLAPRPRSRRRARCAARLGNAPRDVGLAARARHERGIHRIDRDQVAQQRRSTGSAWNDMCMANRKIERVERCGRIHRLDRRATGFRRVPASGTPTQLASCSVGSGRTDAAPSSAGGSRECPEPKRPASSPKPTRISTSTGSLRHRRRALPALLAHVRSRRGRRRRAFPSTKLLGPMASAIDVALPRRESKQGRGHKGFEVRGEPSMSIDEAARRRDFTINAISWDPLSDE